MPGSELLPCPARLTAGDKGRDHTRSVAMQGVSDGHEGPGVEAQPSCDKEPLPPARERLRRCLRVASACWSLSGLQALRDLISFSFLAGADVSRLSRLCCCGSSKEKVSEGAKSKVCVKIAQGK